MDTSTLVSAALRIESVPHQALSKALGSCDVCASMETLAELEHVLDRDKFDRYLDRESRRAFVALMRRHVRLFAVQDVGILTAHPTCRDPRDTQFLALALTAEADALVSSDEDLLIMHPWCGIPIMTPTEFLTTPDV
jgi:uncharacterized protein